jgi:hypothetical protein
MDRILQGTQIKSKKQQTSSEEGGLSSKRSKFNALVQFEGWPPAPSPSVLAVRKSCVTDRTEEISRDAVQGGRGGV